jgi:hypothetical protein
MIGSSTICASGCGSRLLVQGGEVGPWSGAEDP